MKSAILMAVFILLVIVFAAGINRMPQRKAEPVLSNSHSHATEDPSCNNSLATKLILMRNGEFIPNKVTVARCTYVEFSNYNKTESLPALGEHDDHIHYPGFVERVLEPGESNGFQAATAGTFPMHDHLHDDTKGELIIK